MGKWLGSGGRRLGNRADRNAVTALGVTEEMFNPTWDVVGTRASFEFLGSHVEFFWREVLRTAEGGIRVEDGEDHGVRGTIDGWVGKWGAFL
jgi:hypothetical protein